jgi:hypothetical protein
MNIHLKMKDRNVKQLLLASGTSGRGRVNGDGKGV